MRFAQIDPAMMDALDLPGIALAAVADDGTPLGRVGARLDGPIASVPAKWLQANEPIARLLLDHLVGLLQAEYGVRELRAAAPSDALFAFYTGSIGMDPWQELVT